MAPEHHTHSLRVRGTPHTFPDRTDTDGGRRGRCGSLSRVHPDFSHKKTRALSLCGCLLPLPYARITGVSYAAARANGFREASLCCALCAQRGPHIGQTLHSSAVGWRVMEVAPARTFTYKFAAAEGVLLCSAFLIIEAEEEHCS